MPTCPVCGSELVCPGCAGRLGGRSKSEAKIQAVLKNMAKAREVGAAQRAQKRAEKGEKP